MAQKTDIAAAKARKQKIILAVAGVALVGMAVIQVPKLMKSGSQPAAAPAAAAPATTAAATTTAPAVSGTAIAATAAAPSAATGTFKPAAYVAGVALPGGSAVPVATSQLASFTLFEAKDPFVQQVGDQTGAEQASVAVAPSPAAGVAAGDTPASGPGSAAKPAPIAFATIMLDGKPQQLEVKQKFPKGEPLFVLVSLTKKKAKIGVAGGAFDNGQNLPLTLGKKVTLVDTATGVRYELKLVYTGSAPEEIEGFSTATDPQAAPAGGTSTVSTAPATAP